MNLSGEELYELLFYWIAVGDWKKDSNDYSKFYAKKQWLEIDEVMGQKIEPAWLIAMKQAYDTLDQYITILLVTRPINKKKSWFFGSTRLSDEKTIEFKIPLTKTKGDYEHILHISYYHETESSDRKDIIPIVRNEQAKNFDSKVQAVDATCPGGGIKSNIRIKDLFVKVQEEFKWNKVNKNTWATNGNPVYLIAVARGKWKSLFQGRSWIGENYKPEDFNDPRRLYQWLSPCWLLNIKSKEEN